ncbi:type VII secretion-associated serine protease mycosin [Streptomyces sp. NPDC014734]|uniref:type VII secretion-associated serine protease mycosin n=1 Tax=Streptomyces sp. NPDC014734 TaxID=3364886 RepID=UPI0036F5D18F
MRTSTAAVVRRGFAVSSAAALLLVGVGPAYAESVRSRQWYLDAMQAERMWELSTGKDVTVAVVDSGVDTSIPDLRGQVLKGLDLAKDSPGDELTDYDGHGTGIASIIAGTGNVSGGGGSFGLAPGAKILPIRLRDDTGKVNGATGNVNFNEDLSAAIRFAVDHGAKIINASVGNAVGGSRQLTDSVRYALDKGALVFAAVGNSADKGNQVEYPAATPGVVGVGAIGQDLYRAKFSQFGPQVDLTAPGVNIVHSCGGGTGMCKSNGTSDATALASASAALIWSKHPKWTNNQVLRVLLNTAGGPSDGVKRNDNVGYGVVRPRIALKNPGDPGPADEYPLPDLAAAESASPSPSTQPSKDGDGAGEGAKPSAASPAADDQGGNTGLWVGLGVAGVAVVGAGAAFGVVRSRRRRAAASASPPHQPPHVYQQPSHQFYQSPQGYQQQPYQPPHAYPSQQPYAPQVPPPGGPEAGAPHRGAPDQGDPAR